MSGGPGTTFAVGQVLGADDVNKWFVPWIAYRTADSSKRTNTTLADDDVLVIPGLAANAVYEFTGLIAYECSLTAGIGFQFVSDSGASARWGSWRKYGDGAGSPGDDTRGSNSNTLASTCTAGTDSLYSGHSWLTFHGLLKMGSSVTGVGLKFQWAEAHTDGTNGTYLKALSYMKVIRVK